MVQKKGGRSERVERNELNFQGLLTELKKYFLPDSITASRPPEGQKDTSRIGKLIYCGNCSCVYFTSLGHWGYSDEPYNEGWQWYFQKEPRCESCGNEKKTSGLEGITLEVFEQGLTNLVKTEKQKIKEIKKHSERCRKELLKIPKEYYYVHGPECKDRYERFTQEASELSIRIKHLQNVLLNWFKQPIEKRRKKYDLIKTLKEEQQEKERELERIRKASELYNFEISAA